MVVISTFLTLPFFIAIAPLLTTPTGDDTYRLPLEMPRASVISHCVRKGRALFSKALSQYIKVEAKRVIDTL